MQNLPLSERLIYCTILKAGKIHNFLLETISKLCRLLFLLLCVLVFIEAAKKPNKKPRGKKAGGKKPARKKPARTTTSAPETDADEDGIYLKPPNKRNKPKRKP
ncbi:unnamed protein product [Cylicocyclus nassatus]|uniref:Uncharacterized protein n=1 Tax=Cylicocyclus nassatus TaxID=53992 RepID=A0AA36M043_CYLNA|nr:unnamed protein product [Cylicocyclus nassatus]